MDAMTTRANLLDILEPMLFEDLIDSFVADGTMSPLEGAARKACYAKDHEMIEFPVRSNGQLDYYEDLVCADLCADIKHNQIKEDLVKVWRQCGKSATAFKDLLRQQEQSDTEVFVQCLDLIRSHQVY